MTPSRFARWFGARRETEVEHEIDEELEFHLAQRVNDLVEQGISHDQARVAALASFGDLTRVRRDCRSAQLAGRVPLERLLLIALALFGMGASLVAWYGWRMAQTERERAMAMYMQALEQAQRAEEAARAVASNLADQLNQPDPADFDPVAALSERWDIAQVLRPAERTAAQWLVLLNAVASEREGPHSADQFMTIEPQSARTVLESIVPHLSEQAEALLWDAAARARGTSARMWPMLGVLASSGRSSIPDWSMRCVEAIAMHDFASGEEARAWLIAQDGKLLPIVLEQGVANLCERLSVIQGAPSGLLDQEQLSWLRQVDLSVLSLVDLDLPGKLRTSCADAAIEAWFESDSGSLQLLAIRWAKALGFSNESLDQFVVPLVGGERPGISREVVREGCTALGRHGLVSAISALCHVLRGEAVRGADGDLDLRITTIRALSNIGERSAVPTIVESLGDAPSPELVQLVGQYGLAELAGLPFNPSMDFAFWKAFVAEQR